MRVLVDMNSIEMHKVLPDDVDSGEKWRHKGLSEDKQCIQFAFCISIEKRINIFRRGAPLKLYCRKEKES